MQAEHVEIDGKLICIHWPVSKVRLGNQTEVHCEDATGPSHCHFSSSALAQEFANWLSA